MADQDLEEEEEEGTDITSQETMIEWERIQLPLDLNQSPAPDPFNGGWSMVNEDRPQIVFPPDNHEGLHIFSGSARPRHDVGDIDLDRVVAPSPLRSPRPIPPIGDAKGGWWDAGLELLRFKVAGIVCSIRNFTAARVSFHSFGCVAPLAGSMMFLLLYLRFRRMRRESILDLIRVIKERDEEMVQKINQLVHQITGMNQVLVALASHQGVPIPKAA